MDCKRLCQVYAQAERKTASFCCFDDLSREQEQVILRAVGLQCSKMDLRVIYVPWIGKLTVKDIASCTYIGVNEGL